MSIPITYQNSSRRKLTSLLIETNETRGHRHEIQEEVYTVISGSGRVKLDDEIIEIKQWDVIRVAPRVARGFEAGPEGLEIIAAGGSKPDGGDGELVEGHWPDE